MSELKTCPYPENYVDQTPEECRETDRESYVEQNRRNIQALKKRESAICCEIERMSTPGAAGALPDAPGGVAHTTYVNTLLASLESIRRMIAHMEGPLEITTFSM